MSGLIQLSFGRRLALTALSALAAVAIFPRLELYPLAFFALVPALFALVNATARQAFWLGFAFNVVHKIGCTYWLVYTINYYGEFHIVWAVLIFALLLAALGVLFALPWYLLGRAVNELRVPLWLAAPVIWVASEQLITVILGGFPWVLYGYALYPDLYACQLADVVSVYGLSLLLVLVNAALAELALRIVGNRGRFPVVPLLTAGLAVAGLYVYGLMRVPQIEAVMAAAPEVKVGLVQGNIDQFDKRNGDRDAILGKYERLSRQAAADGPDLIAWPETSVPGFQDRRLKPRPFMVELVRNIGVPMLLGMPSKYVPTPALRVNYNTAYLYSAEGRVLGQYDKNHMVPFGEYVPLKRWLRLLAPDQTGRTLGFSPSGVFNVIDAPPGPLGVIICYEAIYPSQGLALARQGIDFFVNITNDAWFGDTSAPRQHLKMTAMRAIENRRWIARAANTGISAVIDPLGRIHSMTEFRQDAVVVDRIGRINLVTPFQRIGLVVPQACGLLALAAIVALCARAWGRIGLFAGLGLAGAGLGLYCVLGPSAGLLTLAAGLWLLELGRRIAGRRGWIGFAALGLVWPLLGLIGWGEAFAAGLLVLEVLPALLLGRLIARRAAAAA